jgi:hypothetical protein
MKTYRASHQVVELFLCTAAFAFACACSDSNSQHDDALANADCGLGRAVVQGECVDDVGSCEVSGLFVRVADFTFASGTVNARIDLDEAGAVHACTVEQGPSGVVSFDHVQRAGGKFESRAIAAGDSNALCMAVLGMPSGEAHVLSRKPVALFSTKDHGQTWTQTPLKGLSTNDIEGALSLPSARAFLGQIAQGVAVALSAKLSLTSAPSLYVATLGPTGLQVVVDGVTKADPNATGHAPQVMETDESGWMVLFERPQAAQVVLGDEALSPLAFTEGLLPRGAMGPEGEIAVLYLDRNSRLQFSLYDAFALHPQEDLGVVGLVRDESAVPWELNLDSQGTAHLAYRDSNQGAGTLLYRGLHLEAPEILSTKVHGRGDQQWAMRLDLCDRASVVLVEQGDQLDQVGQVGQGRWGLVVWEGR